MAFWLDDLDAFLADFGQSVIWSAITYKGIFHNEFEAAMLFSGEIESRGPFIEVKESDFSAITQADTVTIDSVVYKITAKEPSGTGTMILRLSKD